MKKILLIALSLTAYIGFSQCTDPVLTDFECSAPSHPLVGAIASVANPFPGGINTSATVGEYTDNGTDPFDALSSDYGMPIDLTTNPVFHIKIYTELTTPIPFAVKVEGSGNGGLEIGTMIDASDEWQEYTFDFSSVAGNGNNQLVVFFNIGENDGTATDTYYIDDLFFGPADGNATACEDPILSDFECDVPSQPITGAVVTVANPFPGGINTSDNVGEYTDDGDEAFDNLAVNYDMPIDLSTNNKFRVKIYTTQTTNLFVKLEGGTSPDAELGNLGDGPDNIDVVDQWTEYEFDFSDQAGENHERLVLFFNGGNNQANPETFFVDDLRWESENLSIDDVSETAFSIYPNPVEDVINIDSKADITAFELFDYSGKRVLNNTSESANLSTIDVSSLSAGIYFLTLKASSITQTLKVVKQ